MNRITHGTNAGGLFIGAKTPFISKLANEMANESKLSTQEFLALCVIFRFGKQLQKECVSRVFPHLFHQ